MRNTAVSRRSRPVTRLDSRGPGRQTGIVTGREWKSLIERVVNERAERGLSQQDVADASGLHVTTVQRLERGRRLRVTSLAALDKGMGWAAGTARSVLAGDSQPPEFEKTASDPTQKITSTEHLALLLLSTLHNEGLDSYQEMRKTWARTLKAEEWAVVRARFAELAGQGNSAVGASPDGGREVGEP